MEAPIDAHQAAQALKEADAAERRSAAVYRYQLAAPYLLMWGIVWILGYGGSGLWPRLARWVLVGPLPGGVGFFWRDICRDGAGQSSATGGVPAAGGGFGLCADRSVGGAAFYRSGCAGGCPDPGRLLLSAAAFP